MFCLSKLGPTDLQPDEVFLLALCIWANVLGSVRMWGWLLLDIFYSIITKNNPNQPIS